MYTSGDLQGLLDNYEADVVVANNIEHNNDRNWNKEDEKKVRKIHKHLSKF